MEQEFPQQKKTEKLIGGEGQRWGGGGGGGEGAVCQALKINFLK